LLRRGISGGRTKPSGRLCLAGLILLFNESVGNSPSFNGFTCRLAIGISFIFFLSSGSGFFLVVSIGAGSSVNRFTLSRVNFTAHSGFAQTDFAADRQVLPIKTKNMIAKRFNIRNCKN